MRTWPDFEAKFFGLNARAGRLLAAALGTGLCALAGQPRVAHAQVTNLLTNGNFETGTFAGWRVVNVRDSSDINTTRNFYLDTPGTQTPGVTNSPGNSYSFNTASNTLPGGGGSFYAVTTSDAPGETALLQSFTTPTAGSGRGLKLTFTFDLFVNDQSGYSNTASDGGSLDYTTGGLSSPRSNQYARVDLLSSAAADFSTNTSDVLFNIPLAVPVNMSPAGSPNPYQRYTVDLTPYVQANTTYKVRFAQVDNLSALNLGVDNVSITAQVTPEPSALALFVFAPALWLARRRPATCVAP